VAQNILKKDEQEKGLRFLNDMSLEELVNIKGIGIVKAIQIKAVMEIATRISRPTNKQKIIIKSPEDISELLMDEMRYEKIEKVKVILLNIKNRILKIIDLCSGGTTKASIEPREIFTEAIKMQATGVVLVHNHPSGDSIPSKSDILFTNKVKCVGEVVGIEVLDHIIIGDGVYTSIKKLGEM
jgi:DNA repair protein radc